MKKLTLTLYYIKPNSYTKIQVNISKDGREKSTKLTFSKGQKSLLKLIKRSKTGTRSVLREDKFIYQILGQYLKPKQKYRGMFETQKSGNKTSSRDIGLNIKTFAIPKVGQDQMSGGVSVLCWHAAPVANVLWKPLAIR